LHTKSRQEKALAEELRRRGVSFYLPLIPKRSMSRGRPRESQVALFPSYVFLCGDEQDRLTALKTNRLAAVHAVADEGALRRDLVQIADLIELGAPLTPESRLTPGQWVRVKSGPCAGFEGTMVKRHGKSRLIVWIGQLFQGASVEIDDFLVEPI